MSSSDRVLLGIDTGGTNTDAVLVDSDDRVIASAKSPTVSDDLTAGISRSIDAVLTTGAIGADRIGLVSLSTTLATNALVEGSGARVCLVLAGFDDAMAARGGLTRAAAVDAVVSVAGGHTPHGEPLVDLDIDAVREAARLHAGTVDAFAVCARFAVRNAEHERRIRATIASDHSHPVTCSHELSALLNGPKRALTCLLNARLIAMIDRLCAAAIGVLGNRGIEAPLMLVRGDGSLVSADFARSRPIETILSGPAASIVGAAHLVDTADAIVVDIGGTTSDIAVLRDGRPHIDENGALVGDHRTMVEAVAVDTHGLGGDSEVVIEDDRHPAGIVIGPRRIQPVSHLAIEHPDLVHAVLDSQLAHDPPPPRAGRFLTARPARAADLAVLSARERDILESVGPGVAPGADVVHTAAQERLVAGLVARGLLRISGLTPTDAAHVLGLHDGFDHAAARKASMLMARRRDARGEPAAESAADLCAMVVDRLQRRSAEIVLDAAFASDGFVTPSPSRSEIVAAGLDRRGNGHSAATHIRIGITDPIIALGAPAATYYPDVARRLDADATVPEHADVANAIGAVVGRVRLTLATKIISPVEGVFRVHDPEATPDFGSLEEAVHWADGQLRARITRDARAAGAADAAVTIAWSPVTAAISGTEHFVEGTVTATATGRPRIT